QLTTTLHPKITATHHLHHLTQNHPLTHFILFSSITGTIGNAGQANYAAANTYLDALAHHRHTHGLPATSLAWGLWNDTNMADQLDEASRARWERNGIKALSPERDMAVFDAALKTGLPVVVPTRFQMDALRAQDRDGVLPALFRRLVPAARRTTRGTAAAATGASSSWATRTAALPRTERESAVRELVRGVVAAVLGHGSPETIDVDRAFKDLGFDSLTGVELRNRLNGATGLRLPSTVVFDRPSPTALADHLLTELSSEADGADTAMSAAASVRSTVPTSSAYLDEPIAIVGMACRYPGGVRSPEDLWNLVASGTDAITSFPTNRGWDLERLYHPDPDHTGTSYAQHGGFLHDADQFDSDFFQLSPREAAATDPQQRLLLETAWETLERAGIDPATIRGSRTGVFTGVMYHDYGARLTPAPEGYEGHLLTGNTSSVVSGRLAYTFGFEGPAITVDTACSSSLVALHLAAQSLRQGECDLALAGGVTVMATPATFIEFSRQRGLSPDGRCKAFSNTANGTGWSEGTGLLLVERLTDAQRKGHRVLAVLRGSAVNQDGASNGLTAPNGPAQERVIRQALTDARLAASEIDAVEAHGTGTTLGDPIEAQALLTTYGQNRQQPLYLGSLKSNIGHTQAAAGVAGIIKMTMAMHHATLPRTLHIDTPTPHVDWTTGTIELLTTQRPWNTPHNRPRRAAISSFGISGTNAHIILEQPPTPNPQQQPEPKQQPNPKPAQDEPTTPTAPPTGALPWVLSAKSPQALRAQASRLRDALRTEPEIPLQDVGLALATSRSTFTHRAVIIAEDRRAFLEGLGALAHGRRSPHLVQGRAAEAGGTTAFVFSGQGSQRPGMGRELAHRFPLFAQALDEVCEHFTPHLELPLKDVMWAEEGSEQAALLDQTQYAQPALFALEVALYRLVTAFGVEPDYLTGHSLGELTAAHLADVLNLTDATTLIAARARLMQTAPTGGAMIALNTTEEHITPHLNKHLSLAAINSPTSLVISGDHDTAHTLAEQFAEQGIRTTALRVSHAFHSPHMDPILDEFRTIAATLTYQTPRIPVLSNITGHIATTEQLTDPNYWTHHIRATVRFADTLTTLNQHHTTTTYLELGPTTTLTPHIHTTTNNTTATSNDSPLIASTLNHRHPETHALTTTLATLHTHTTPLTWDDYFTHRPDPAAPLPVLPTYAFQRTHYWLPAPRREAAGGSAPAEITTTAGAPTEADGQVPLFQDLLAGVSEDEWETALLDLVRVHAAEVLGHSSPEQIEPGDNFMEIGFSSFTALDVRNRLCEATGLQLPPVLLFDHPTPRELVTHIAEKLATAGAGAPPRDPDTT
ncbi:beta-ketoacyl synthase N-terminal-like domain-containing protein, partial [Streptomyces sp. NPDC058000]|uniref:type I polyketide synthase n=1 Tax=Streptomyces sp. NPDC058000 TaxID=3346299 RepID=UPI0036F11EDD